MFKQHTIKGNLKKLALVLGLLAGLVFFSAATTTAQAASDPTCDYSVTGTIGQRYTWDRGQVVCYNIEFREYAEVFVIAVKALDPGGKYDVYLSPGWLGTGQKLETKINRKPIRKSDKTVRLAFNNDTLDLNQRYTIALVPRSGYSAGSRAAMRITTEGVWGATRPQDNNGGDLGWIPSQTSFDVLVAPEGLTIYPLDISCPGNVAVTFSATITNGSDPDPRVTVRMFGPGDDEAWSATEADYYDAQQYLVTESHIRTGTEWYLQFRNRGKSPIAVLGMVRMPDDDCPPVQVKRTAAFQFDGTKGQAFDVTLEQEHRNVNYWNNWECYVDGDNNGGYDRNTLLFWDVSSIPFGSKVTKATIQLTVTNSSVDSYNVYDVRKPWHTYFATWDDATSGKPWSRGGATGSADVGSVVGRLSAPNLGTTTITLSPAVVQKWVNSRLDNNGVLIANSAADDGIDFHCLESTSKSKRPKLVVEYEN